MASSKIEPRARAKAPKAAKATQAKPPHAGIANPPDATAANPATVTAAEAATDANPATVTAAVTAAEAATGANPAAMAAHAALALQCAQLAQHGAEPWRAAAWQAVLGDMAHPASETGRADKSIPYAQARKRYALDAPQLQAVVGDLRLQGLIWWWGTSIDLTNETPQRAQALLQAEQAGPVGESALMAQWRAPSEKELTQRDPARFGHRLRLQEAHWPLWPSRGAPDAGGEKVDPANPAIQAKAVKTPDFYAKSLHRMAQKLGDASHPDQPETPATAVAALNDALALAKQMPAKESLWLAWQTQLYSDGALPPARQLAVDALVLNWHMHRAGKDAAGAQALVAHLAQRHGPAGLVRAVAQALLHRIQGAGTHKWITPFALAQSETEPIAADAPVLQAVRQTLLQTPDAEFAGAVDAGLQVLADVPLARQPDFACLFVGAPQVAQAVLARLKPAKRWPGRASLLAMVLPDEDLAQIRSDRLGFDPDVLWHSAHRVQGLLRSRGEAALPLLQLAAHYAMAGAALVLFNHPHAILALASVEKMRFEHQQRLELACRRWPLAAAVGLAWHVAQGEGETTRSRGLLTRVLGELGAAQALAWPWLTGDALQLVQGVTGGPAQPALPVAAAKDLPAVLAHPPWRTAPKPSGRRTAAAWALRDEALPTELNWGTHAHLVPATPPRWVAGSESEQLGALGMSQAATLALPEAEPVRAALRAGDAPAVGAAWRALRHAVPPDQAWAFNWLAAPDLLRLGPLAVPVWAGLSPHVSWQRAWAFVPHCGLAALPGLALAVQRNFSDLCTELLFFGDERLAPHALHAAFGTQAHAQAGRQWLARWPQHGAAAVIRGVLQRTGKTQQEAVHAGRWLVAQGHGDALVQQIQRLVQPEAQAAAQAHVQALLQASPTAAHPRTVAALPAFWTPASWQAVLLHNGQPLPAPAVDALGEMLSFPFAQGRYDGLAEVRAACSAASLAAFGWDLMTAWLAAGAAPKFNWAMTALGVLGDGDAATRLGELLAKWPTQGASARAKLALSVLVEMGHDDAHRVLNALADAPSGLSHDAQEALAAAAQSKGLTVDALQDQIVPDLGLDARGQRLLDFGPRQFVLGVDAQLKPHLRAWAQGEIGARLRSLPPVGQRDDQLLANNATAEFKRIKAQLRAIAAAQGPRLEQAMCTGRRWSPAEFDRLFARHPLMRQLATHLVWAVFAPGDAGMQLGRPDHVLVAFRMAEDGQLTTAHDNPYVLAPPPDAQIGIPHPLEMPATRWAEFAQLFADYALVQPFAQIGREADRTLTPGTEHQMLAAWVGQALAPLRLLGLPARGWQPVNAWGVQANFSRALPGQRHLNLTVKPGVDMPAPAKSGEQIVTGLAITRASDAPAGEVSVTTLSEVLRDLAQLRP